MTPNTDKILVLTLVLVLSLIAVPAFLGQVKKTEMNCMDKLYMPKEHTDNTTESRLAYFGNAKLTDCKQYEKQPSTSPPDKTALNGFTTNTKTSTTTLIADGEKLTVHTQTRNRYLYVLLFILAALHPAIIFGVLWNPVNKLLKRLKSSPTFKRYNFLESLFITAAMLSLPAMMSVAVLTCAHINETAFSSYVKNIVFDSSKKIITLDNNAMIAVTKFKALIPTVRGDVVLLYSDDKGYNTYKILFRAKDKDDAVKAVSTIYADIF
ncbi:hypothetical protein [Candidatus Magnetomonas plexicatena]|uniref:hypothetical protein n=1 Tax=Candidatus Magnetomonas plexicatena TaxID=2552947 RepID=UPI00110370B5|nr:hypothetical protein E2O03_001950 [Nitrospirales bacterium LBB_01]